MMRGKILCREKMSLLLLLFFFFSLSLSWKKYVFLAISRWKMGRETIPYRVEEDSSTVLGDKCYVVKFFRNSFLVGISRIRSTII